ncbi:hypothetical protein HY968_01695 [Candidatus Kaiserbacteria bacterium]|nr:hypothetical protein [Candidatus Kaiserbacteria bacterium]
MVEKEIPKRLEVEKDIVALMDQLGIPKGNILMRDAASGLRSDVHRREAERRNFLYMAEHGVLTKESVRRLDESALHILNISILSMEHARLAFFCDAGLLRADTLPRLCTNDWVRSPMVSLPLHAWKYMYQAELWKRPDAPGGTWGFTVPDPHYMIDIMEKWPAYVPKTENERVSPLLFAIGAHEQETFKRFALQLAECETAGIIKPEVPWAEQFNAMFMHYLRQTPMYQKILKNGEIPDNERRANARAVNAKQMDLIKKELDKGQLANYECQSMRDNVYIEAPVPDSMELVGYIRYRKNTERMDRFAAAVDMKSSSWMIENRYSRLFSKLGIAPSLVPSNDTMMRPKSVEAVVPQAVFHPVKGPEFRKLGLFGRFVVFTHSNAKEMQNIFSIPIITHATAQTKDKIETGNLDKPYVLMQVDHDFTDPGRVYDQRHGKRPVLEPNFAGDVKMMINEMLRTITELEDIELTRAGVKKRKRRKKK